uniref:Uncharacterized protein n=1 Tax=Meloidogyne javanica TaxID=6303 RepID=A0A915MLN3_MELJA
MKYNRWEYNNKIDKFEIGWNEIIKKFVEDKFGIEIVKVSIVEGLQYIGVDIKMFEALESEGKRYKTKMLTEEERKIRAKIIEMFYYGEQHHGLQAEVARKLGIDRKYVYYIIE